MAEPNNNSTMGALMRMGIGVPIGLISILAMMILPLPPVMLDVLFTFNIALSLVIVMAVFNVKRPLEFAIFPTVLLLVTILRLALNVASTRVVLLHGHEGSHAAGKVIAKGTPDEIRASPHPFVNQFVNGKPDGPVPFHYPAPDYAADLEVVSV